MRIFAAMLLLALGVSADTPQEAPEIARARQEAERIRTLVEAGALPRASLEQAQQKLVEAQDDAVLRRTLYGNIGVEELTEEQGEEMVAAARRQLARSQEKVGQAKKLVDAGVAPRTSLTPALEDLDRRRKTVDLAESRARLLQELAEIVRTEEAAEASVERPEEVRTVAERFDGDGGFSNRHLDLIQAAYLREFGRALPVSARGATALHRALGFDHRGRIDVALNPDQKEGLWLRRFLEHLRIPYFAFRRAVPGKATAAHIHIGPPSLRLRAAD